MSPHGAERRRGHRALARFRRLAALAASLLVIDAGAATATAIPLLDLPPGVKTISLGVSDVTVHGSFDWALWGDWGRGWTIGLAGGFDYADTFRRDSHNMLALRVGRRLAGDWPVTVGALLSAGANVVDPLAPLPNPTSQRFSGDFLYWVQPALVFASTVENDKVWLRGTLGPVIGRWSEGVWLLPWIAPNVEVGYRFNPAHELVVGGGYASPYSLGWRTAF